MCARRRYKHTQDLALLALNTHHLHAGKSVLRSVKRVLGLGNVFPVFIAITYAAGGCKTLLMLSVISNSAIHRWCCGGSLMELNRELNGCGEEQRSK